MAQIGLGVVPWVVSLWTHAPWRYGLWALGLAVDLLIIFTLTVERMTAGLGRRRAERAERAGQRRRPAVQSSEPVHLDSAHFGERLGLFVIIVLGEGVLVVTEGMTSVEHWTGAVYRVVLAALCLLGALAGAVGGRGVRWTVAVLAPGLLVPAMVGFLHPGPPATVWPLTAAVVAQLAVPRLLARRTRQ